ncbi:MAG: SDR family NAD(P)-dependent oxidoreductase [Candidatus Saccharibacteria bacterium]|nr:SDR family NAD(P)-dependent oxidoreductase [Candidatus Saccharibacteria bacterium]
MTKIAFITGASSGMGQRMAYLLSGGKSAPDEVWLLSRREDRLSKLAEALETRNPALKARVIAKDLMNPEDIREIAALLAERRPGITFLVNAAGFGKIGSVAELPLSAQTDMIRLNCEALTAVTRLCLPYMVKGKGRIINFASAAAFLPQPRFAVYAATKAFVLSFSRALSEELSKDGIAVTAVCPGPVRTEFFDIAEELHAVPLYKKLAMADADRVVARAFRDSMKRKRVSVYGMTMRLFALSAKLLPAGFFFFFIRIINSRRNG